MAHSTTWNAAFEATPANGDNVSQGDDIIRQLKTSIGERMTLDHLWNKASPDDTNDGKHKFVTMKEQAATPTTPESGFGMLYGIAVDAGTGFYSLDDAGLIAGIDGGHNSLLNSDKTLTVEEGTFITMPVATDDKIVTLPTTSVRAGHRITLYNSGTDGYELKVRPSAEAVYYNLDDSEWVELAALQDTPTNAEHWMKVGGTTRVETFTSGSGTWTAPTGVHRAWVEVQGGGGGGGGGSWPYHGGNGGGGGGYCASNYVLVPGNGYAYAVGAASGAGGAGNNSTWDATITAGGGGGGLFGSNYTNSAAGGTAVGGDINIPGQGGGFSSPGNASFGVAGGVGGSSRLGGGGRGGQSPAAGGGYGGGGGGDSDSGTGSTGAAGIIIITY